MSALPKPLPELPTAGTHERELSPLEHAELIARKSQGHTVQASAAALMAYHATQEMEAQLKKDIRRQYMDEIRHSARKTMKDEAAGWRSSVKQDLIKFLVEQTQQGYSVTRKQLITQAASHVVNRRFTGKFKARIQDSSIKRFLTIPLEQEIRKAAAEKISAAISPRRA